MSITSVDIGRKRPASARAGTRFARFVSSPARRGGSSYIENFGSG
jgi:hypothetical protein